MAFLLKHSISGLSLCLRKSENPKLTVVTVADYCISYCLLLQSFMLFNFIVPIISSFSADLPNFMSIQCRLFIFRIFKIKKVVIVPVELSSRYRIAKL